MSAAALTAIPVADPVFHTPDQTRADLEAALRGSTAPAQLRVIGQSERGREILGLTLGRGPIHVSLVAGNHADEPVGHETLRALALHILTNPDECADLLDRFTLAVIPHTNPDGAALNQPWIERWPDPLAFLRLAHREPPGRDLEFGYPNHHPSAPDDAGAESTAMLPLRVENEHAADFLAAHAPYHLHLSLHGMAVAEGAWLLIEKHWIDRTADLRRAWLDAIARHGLDPFDWDRGGDKGFEYIGPGFSTTPRGQAMREHFLAENDAATAALFHNSSMEYIRSLGGDPLCLVTELPLFVLHDEPATTSASAGHAQTEPAAPGVPHRYHRYKQALPRLRLELERHPDLTRSKLFTDHLPGLTLDPLPLADAIQLQLHAIQLGLETVAEAC